MEAIGHDRYSATGHDAQGMPAKGLLESLELSGIAEDLQLEA
jgi:hypothetical protein